MRQAVAQRQGQARISDTQLRRTHIDKVDFAQMEPEARRAFLRNLNEPPQLKLSVPTRRRQAAAAKRCAQEGQRECKSLPRTCEARLRAAGRCPDECKRCWPQPATRSPEGPPSAKPRRARRDKIVFGARQANAQAAAQRAAKQVRRQKHRQRRKSRGRPFASRAQRQRVARSSPRRSAQARDRAPLKFQRVTTIVWFRQDLRLADNPALDAAVKRGEPVIPLYIWSPEDDGDWPPGAASRWWLHHSLHARSMKRLALVARASILAKGRATGVLASDRRASWRNRRALESPLRTRRTRMLRRRGENLSRTRYANSVIQRRSARRTLGPSEPQRQTLPRLHALCAGWCAI